MPAHTRYIPPLEENPDALRSVISFRREDYLWDPGRPLINPHTKKRLYLPLTEESGALRGPNLLDCIEKTTNKEKEIVWKLRKDADFFEHPDKRKKTNAALRKKGKPPITNPLKTEYITGGTLADDNFERCVKISKPSTVSIAKVVHVCAIGLYGDPFLAQKKIGSMAQLAWQDDIARSFELFNLLHDEREIIDTEFPSHLKTHAAISKIVEHELHCEICRWLGLDPSMDIPKRPRGRPVGSKSNHSRAKQATDDSEYIHFDFTDDDEVEGFLIKTFLGWPKGVPLSNLKIEQLLHLLVELRKIEKEYDADLLEAYLDLVNENWRDECLGEVAEPSIDNLNPYHVLNIADNVSDDEVKKAYRLAMRTMHPDKAPISAVFAQMVNDAYQSIRRERGMK